MQSRFSWRLGAAILVLGTLVGLIISSGFEFPKASQSSPPSLPGRTIVLGSQQTVPPGLLDLQNTSEAFVYISELVVPTVVSIQSTRVISSADMEKFHDREELKDFFRFRIPRDLRQQGSGSGIIVSNEGYILTNVHVVDKAERLRVLLNDNREFEAEIVGMDPLTEVAVIKIDSENLPVANLGDSDKMRVGEWVLAVGNPLELTSTVTAGIISAKERQINIIRDTPYSVENFIQTDAAINPGNSGGALVNLKGEVIGVNTAIATETGYNAGFGFAIPINLAKKIMTDLIGKGRVERGFLGIAMINIDEKKAKALSLERPRGVFIDRVLPDSPAQRAGLRPKDIIITIGNAEVNKSNQVQAIIARKNPGDVINLELLRRGRKLELAVTLGFRQSESAQLTRNSRPEETSGLGINCENVTADKAAELNYNGRQGVLVTDVTRGGSAFAAGIRKGDIITEIDDQPVENKKDFKRVTSALGRGQVAIFTVVRGMEQQHIFVESPD